MFGILSKNCHEATSETAQDNKRTSRKIVLIEFNYLTGVYYRLKYFIREQMVRLKIMQNGKGEQNGEYKWNGMVFSILK